jgi:hypothetical protein
VTKERCAVCHFPDKAGWPPADTNGDGQKNCSDDPSKCGPAGKPRGFTAWQKAFKPGDTADGDYLSSMNTVTWTVAKGRVEGGKRAESINDANNPDAHMKSASETGTKMGCIDCHYLVGGDVTANADGTYTESPVRYPALTDASGAVVQPAMDVLKIDHQFAKGNNAPDGKNMDQLDNTVTCASCHITHEHPNVALSNGEYILSGASTTTVVPTPAHAGFPANHLEKIDCKTCHIPVLNAPMKQYIADFTVGPYRTFERTQTVENSAGVNIQPLYMWRATEHDGSGVQIEPITTMAVPVWANRVVNADGSISFSPTFQRLARSAAEHYRTDRGNDGTVYSWTLNAPQAGDTTLIVNTTEEITAFVDILKNPSAHDLTNPAVAEPVMHFYFNQFAVSHNIAKKGTGKILGSEAGGGCVMCHSSKDPLSPNYSPKSVSFFDKTYTIFTPPTEGGGLKQTVIDGIKRVNVKFGARKADNTPFTIDLTNNDGANVGSTLKQSEVLGYDAAQLAKLTNPATAGVPSPIARFTYAMNGLSVSTDAAATYCPSGDCGYSWNFGDAGTATGSTALHLYTAAGTYTITLSVTDNVNFTSNAASLSVSVAPVDLAPVPAFTSNLVSAGTVSTSYDWTVSLTDASTDEAPATLAITVNWGDGTVQETKTGAGAQFTHAYGAAGSYTITYKVTDAGGQSGTKTQALTLTRYKVSGKALRSDGTTAVSGVKIDLKQGAATVKTVYTDTAGNYTATFLKAGTYTVTPSKLGYTFNSVDVVLGPDKVVNAVAVTP